MRMASMRENMERGSPLEGAEEFDGEIRRSAIPSGSGYRWRETKVINVSSLLHRVFFFFFMFM
jgi:hypothetical protein